MGDAIHVHFTISPTLARHVEVMVDSPDTRYKSKTDFWRDVADTHINDWYTTGRGSGNPIQQSQWKLDRIRRELTESENLVDDLEETYIKLRKEGNLREMQAFHELAEFAYMAGTFSPKDLQRLEYLRDSIDLSANVDNPRCAEWSQMREMKEKIDNITPSGVPIKAQFDADGWPLGD